MAVSVTVQVTIPELLINSSVVRFKIEQMMKSKTGPELMRMFKKTTQGWEHNINFYQRNRNTSNEVSVTVFTRFKQYAIVNFGSPPHDIPLSPKTNGVLRFRKGYSAATRPRIIGSRKKSYSGPFYTARQVSHPGFEAREFDEAIAEEIAKTFPDDVQEAITIGSKIL